MTTVTAAPAYWAAVLPEVGDLARANAVAALLTTGSKLKFYDAAGTLIRTVTTAAWVRQALSASKYPIVPGAFTGGQSGAGTPVLVVATTSADVEIFRTTAGVSSGVFQLPSAFVADQDLTEGPFKLFYPASEAAAAGKVWFPGHYLMVIDDTNRLGMLDSRRNLVRYDPNWAGYYGHYWWHRMESTEGVYDFSIVLDDLDKAEADGKKMWVWPQNRSFHGTSRGLFCPAYITDAGWTYAYTASGENFYGCKLWVPGCGEAWMNFIAALCAAIKDHPALQGIATEECSQSGAWLQVGYTWQAMNEFLLEQSRVGSENIGTRLWHNNMGWSNESSTNYTEQYRMTDTMVRVHKTGISPNDLRISSNTAIKNTTYGKYLFDRYAGEAFHYSAVEWGTFFLPETPRQIIDYAVDVLNMHFIGWQVVTSSTATFTTSDVIAEVTRQNGRIATARPLIVPA